MSPKVCDCTLASGAVKPTPNNRRESFFDAPVAGANSPEIIREKKTFRVKNFFESTSFSTWKNCLTIRAPINRTLQGRKTDVVPRDFFITRINAPTVLSNSSRKQIVTTQIAVKTRCDDPKLQIPPLNTSPPRANLPDQPPRLGAQSSWCFPRVVHFRLRRYSS